MGLVAQRLKSAFGAIMTNHGAAERLLGERALPRMMSKPPNNAFPMMEVVSRRWRRCPRQFLLVADTHEFFQPSCNEAWAKI